MRADAVKQFVLSMLSTTDTDSGGSRQMSAVDLLEQARDRLAAAPIADDAIRVELMTTIGAGLRGLGEASLAEPVLADATRLAATSLGDRGRASAAAHAAYGFVLFARSQSDLAAHQFDAAERLARREGDMAVLSAALRGQAILHTDKGDWERAIAHAWEAVGAAERQTPPIDKRPVVAAYSQVSLLIHDSNRKGSLEPARRAYALARELYGDRPAALLLQARAAHDVMRSM